MSATQLTIPAPSIEDRQFTKPLLCGPGPCDYWPSVNEALSRPVLSPLCDETFNVLDDIRAGLQYVFQTRSKMVFAMSGSGHSGMEAIISNLVGPNETLLIASRGIWDERALGIATRYGIKTEICQVPFNSTFSLESLESYLEKIRPAALFVTHGDSSTGTVQQLKGLGKLCHQYGALLLVDTVVSLAAEPFFMDEWDVDAVYSSTQKALSGPAGISPVAFGERAQQKIQNRTFEPPFYFDAKLLADQWNCFGNTRKYHHTMSPPLLWALRCCLQEIIKETLPKGWERHAAVTAHFQKRVQQLSLEFLVPVPEQRLVTVTTVVLPQGYDYVEFVRYMRKQTIHNMSRKLTVAAPAIVDRQFIKPLLCGPGPCNYWPSVAEALARPVISPFCDETYNVLDDIRAGLQYLFQTESKMVFAMTGSGHAGMEAVISNLVGPTETMLVANRGIWDDRATIMATRYGIKTETIRVPAGSTFSMEILKENLEKTRPAALFITHGDGSTGTVQQLEGLGKLCHEFGTLLLVDAVVSIGGEPFYMDEWEVDAVYASTQKALSGPAGISPVAFSERAQKKMQNRTFEPPFYFDAKLLADQWNCFGNSRKYHHTMSPPLLWALRCCLQEIVKHNLTELWDRHSSVTKYFHKRVQELPCELLVPDPRDRLATASTVILPEGYDHSEFINYMKIHCNILVSPGLGPTLGKSLRIGIMGYNSSISVADTIADSMAEALAALKKH